MTGRHPLIRCVLLIALVMTSGCLTPEGPGPRRTSAHLPQAAVFLAAADYRRAIDACQLEVTERPSVSSYVYLTYVYHALDAYIESLVRADRWVMMEQLAFSLSSGRAEDLLDLPDVLPRIAKELIQQSARKQADVVAAMAARVNEEATNRLWAQQQRWREHKPDGWWRGIPPEWGPDW